MLGWGLLSLFKLDTQTYAWVLIQLVLGIGIGILYSSTLFPVLAPVPVKQGPHAMGFYVFMRNFGQTFGVSIGGTILQNQVGRDLSCRVNSTDSSVTLKTTSRDHFTNPRRRIRTVSLVCPSSGAHTNPSGRSQSSQSSKLWLQTPKSSSSRLSTIAYDYFGSL
jgi:hypothetical protein